MHSSIVLVVVITNSIVQEELSGPGVDSSAPSVGNPEPSGDDDNFDFLGVGDMAMPMDDLEHSGLRITRMSTKGLLQVLSFGNSTLQGELNSSNGYEARCNVDSDDMEIGVVSTVHTLWIGLLVVALDLSEVFEHRSVRWRTLTSTSPPNIHIDSRRTRPSTSPCSFRINNHTNSHNQAPRPAVRRCVGSPASPSSAASCEGWSGTGSTATLGPRVTLPTSTWRSART